MNNDELLTYYQQELTFIRRLGAEFADAHPKIAGRLGLSHNNVEDPHVARLIEAFAFANARIRYKLEDDFSDISDALLDILHPHYLAPIPAMSIVQFQPEPAQLLAKKTLAANTLLATDTGHGTNCYFTTCYSVDILPIYIEQAVLKGQPLQAPDLQPLTNIAAVLQISLRCYQEKLSFSQLNMDKLRFFIQAPLQDAYALYELLLHHTVAIALAHSADDTQPIILDAKTLQAVGFAAEESLLPYHSRTFAGYRFLTEFFALPEKFLFFELKNLTASLQAKFTAPGERLEIFFYLDQLNPVLEKNLTAQFFALGCTPIINLFAKQAEPFELTHTQSEYHLIADAHQPPQATEIYAVKRVIATNEHGQEQEYQPFYGLQHYQNTYYYHARRKPAWEGAHYLMQGTEIFLSFSDVNFNPVQTEKIFITTDILCTNRDLPAQLPFGGEGLSLQLAEQKTDMVQTIKCLQPITTVKRPALRHGARWRYISHLSLNHLSLTCDNEGIEALRNLLKLYDFTENKQQTIVEGLLSIHSETTTARNPNSHHGNVFWQGTKIILTIDKNKFIGTSLYLFGCILERFFGLYTTINSFTELVLVNQHREELYHWQPRVGEKSLL